MADASEEKEVVLYISAHGLEPEDIKLPPDLHTWEQLLDDSKILNEQGCRGLPNFVTPRRYIEDFFRVLNKPHKEKNITDILITESNILREQKKKIFSIETTPLTRSVSSPYMKLKFIMTTDTYYKNNFVYNILKSFRPDIFHHIITFQETPQSSSGFSKTFQDIYTGFFKLFKSDRSEPLRTLTYEEEQSYIYQPRPGFLKMIDSIHRLFLESEKISGNDMKKLDDFFKKLKMLLHTPINFVDFLKIIDNVYTYFKGSKSTYKDMTFSSSCYQSFKMEEIVNEKLFFMYKSGETKENIKLMNYGIYLLYDSDNKDNDAFLEYSDKINLLRESSSELGISYVEPFKRELLTNCKSEPIYLSKILLFFFKQGYKVTIITNSCRRSNGEFEIEQKCDVLLSEDVKDLEDYIKYIKKMKRMTKSLKRSPEKTLKTPPKSSKPPGTERSKTGKSPMTTMILRKRGQGQGISNLSKPTLKKSLVSKFKKSSVKKSTKNVKKSTKNLKKKSTKNLKKSRTKSLKKSTKNLKKSRTKSLKKVNNEKSKK